MTREFCVIDAHLSLRHFTEEYVLTQTNPAPAYTYYVASEGSYRGLIKAEDLQSIERSQWDSKTLGDIAHLLSEIATFAAKMPLFAVIQTLETLGENRITVLSPAGAVAGVIDRGDIVKAIANEQNSPISDAEIRRIKNISGVSTTTCDHQNDSGRE